MTTRAYRAWDLLLTAVLLTAALLVHATAYDAVPANRSPDVVSLILTAAAIVPVALRRAYPLATLIACWPGLLALMALQHSVGASTLGVEVAFYTVVAWDTRRNARWAVLVLLAGLAATTALQPSDLSAEGIAVNGAILVGGWILGTGSRQRRERHAEDIARAQFQAQAERDRAARATAEERLRITSELHDVIGHALSVMVVQAGVAEHLMDSRPAQARAAVTAIMETGRSSLAEMRRMLAVLREGDPAGDGVDAEPAPGLVQLPRLVERVERAGLPVTLTVAGGDAPLPAGVELAAYRIVQEALTNCLKHARATRAEVRLTCTAQAVEIEVTDDGAGPAQPAADADGGPAVRGHGLIGMRERVAMYRGELDSGRVHGGGFRVWALLPLGTQVQP
ncbi:sensor histidine kinase [Dactylosporangium sp. NPDC049525]|uniref:sensor histidine kinase n=1 Tax=Dactylosporangium sp. NPDC049525 TaxID=3154730 RepID=UPI003440AA2D